MAFKLRDKNPVQDAANRMFLARKLKDDESKAADDNNANDDVNDSENRVKKPNNSWRTNVGKNKSSNNHGRKKFLKEKGPIGLIILALAGSGGALSLLFGGVLAPITFITNVANDLNDQLALLDNRNMSMAKNKVSTSETDEALSGCSVLSLRCKFKTMSKLQAEKYNKAGIEVTGEETGLFKDRLKPTKFKFEGKEMSPKEFAAELKTNSNLRLAFKRGLNMKYMGYSDKTFFSRVLERFGISERPPELKGTHEERVNELMNKTGGTIDDLAFTPVEEIDENGKTTPTDKFKLEGDTSPNPRTYTQSEVASMKKSIAVVKVANEPPSRFKTNMLGALSVLGAADLACSAIKVVGAATIAAKVSNSMQLAKYAMPIMSLVGKMKAGDISAEDAQVLGEFFTNPDTRETISNIKASENKSAELETIPNPNYGKNAMDSDLYRMSATGETASKSASNNQYALGVGLGTLLSFSAGGIANTASILNTIINIGSDNATCGFVQNWFVRGAGLVGGIAAGAFSGGTALAWTVGAFAAIYVGFYAVTHILNSALSGNLFNDSMSESPVDRGAAVWTGISVITGEAAKSRGMIPGNADQIIAYNQLQNESKLDYIAIESQDTNPLDATSQYSFLGSFIGSIKNHFSSSVDISSSINSISSLVSSSLYSAVNPRTAYAATITKDRFKGCDDSDYKKMKIDADIQCNIRYIMPSSDLSIDTDEAAKYMEDNGYVEKNTTTGLPVGYTEPSASESQGWAMDTIKGLTNTFYSARQYASDVSGNYEKYLDYCVYRAMPFGETYEENGAYGAVEKDWQNGNNCLKLEAPYNYFRIYTADKTVQSAIDEEDGLTYSTSTGLAGL